MEVINSFFSNIKDKLTNPFFGTLILVLIIHHWELWYTIFNFDDDCTLNDKIVIIKNYLGDNLTWKMFICDIIKAAIIMFIGYAVVIGTRTLSMWFEFFLMPVITKKIVNDKVVLKAEYDDLVKERDEYFDQYQVQRKNVREFSLTIDEQTDRIKLKDSNYADQSNTINNLQSSLEQTNSKLSIANTDLTRVETELEKLKENSEKSNILNNVKSKNLEQYDKLFFSEENEDHYKTVMNFPDEIIRIVLELNRENLWQSFLSIGKYYIHGGAIGQDVVDELTKKEVLISRGSFYNSHEFSSIGKIIWHYRAIFERLK